jgi:molecular chaperone GrpE
MQNMQRRSQEEKAQASDYAITKFARDLTSSLDILALALRSVPESLRAKPKDATETEDPRKAVAELYSGVELTSKSIVDMLRMHGVTTFDPTGEKFNPLEHEALYQAPVPGKEPGTVLECSKAGYKIKDRILRAAQVGVVQEAA